MRRKSTRSSVIALAVSILVFAACGDGPTIPRSDQGQVTGFITRLAIEPHDGHPVVLVEEKPGRAEVGQKLFFHLSTETEIFVRLGGDELARGSAADLTVGRLVRAYKGPIITDSYPGATSAPRIDILR